MTITSKFNGKCKKCGGIIAKGEEIEWSKENGSQHVTCPLGNKAFRPQPKPSQQHPRFQHLEQAYKKAVQAVKKETAAPTATVDPYSCPANTSARASAGYWTQLYQQAEREARYA